MTDDRVRFAFQSRRFRAQASRAARTVHYGRLFARLEADPGALAIEDVPVTSKEALRASPDEFVARDARPFMCVTSTGTSGDPTAVHFSEREWHAIGAISALGHLTAGTLRPEDRVLICVTHRGVLPNHGVIWPCGAIGACVHVVGMASPDAVLTLLAKRHRVIGVKRQVNVLTANPSYLGMLVEQGLAGGWRPQSFGLEKVLVGGEVLTPGLQERAQRLFGPVRFIENYQLTELVPFGGRRCSHGHLHFAPTVGLLEVLDPDGGTPAADNEVGTIVGTPFFPFRETTVLLRFDTGDMVQVPPRPLLCELRHVPATGPVLGRRAGAVRHDDGWTFTRDVAEALEATEEVPLPARYGFWKAQSGVALEFVARPDRTAVARRRVSEALEARNVPLRTLSVVDDPGDLKHPVKLRCDCDEGAHPGRRVAPVLPVTRTARSERR